MGEKKKAATAAKSAVPKGKDVTATAEKAAPAPVNPDAAPPISGFPVHWDPTGYKLDVNGASIGFNKDGTVLVDAMNEDQAAELCALHKLPVDMAQFTHFEEGVGTVSYDHRGERVITAE